MNTSVDTITAKIYVGLREGYTDKVHSLDELKEVIQKRADIGGVCVTVTPTTYIYKQGREEGAIIGIINYPRFPFTKKQVEELAEELAMACKEKFKQERVSIEYQDRTVMIE